MNAPQKNAAAHVVRAPQGTALSCQNWLIEAAYRMIQNNLDPDVAERPERASTGAQREAQSIA